MRIRPPKFNNKKRLVRSESGGYYLATDGGRYEEYRPAQHRKPQKQGFLKRVLGMFTRFLNRPNPDLTTEQGSSAASPSLYGMSLLQQRYERREKIQRLRAMVTDEP